MREMIDGGFQMQRLGMVMEPEPGNPLEVEGVLNPAAVRGPDGQLYLFPRLVAKGNYSRIGIARVKFNEAGDPAGVERLGIALEPEADYELRPDGGGGCEDPRITFVEPLQRYVMTYTAFSPEGPRIALALSEDLFHWQRLGLATFRPYEGIEFDDVDDKDASIFPVAIPDPSGQPAMAILHRPLFPGTRPEETACHPASRVVDLDRESIWISYCPMASGGERTISPRPLYLASPAGQSGVALGAAQDRRRHSADPDPARLAGHLPRRQRTGGAEQRQPSVMLLRRRDGALEGASAGDPLSFAGAGADAGAAAGTQRDRRQRRVSHRHRPARRSRLAGSLRRLLRDGRQPDRRGASRRAGCPAAGRSRRLPGSKGVMRLTL